MKCSKCDRPATIGIDKDWIKRPGNEQYTYYCAKHNVFESPKGSYSYKMSLAFRKIVEVKDESHS